MTTLEQALFSAKQRRAEEYKAHSADYQQVDVSEVGVAILTKSIINLIIAEQNILFMHYIYQQDYSEIEQILDVENVETQLINLKLLFAEILNLDKSIISEKSMQVVCRSAFEAVNSIDKNTKTKTKSYKKLSKVASFALFFIITTSAFLIINSFAEGGVFGWFSKNFIEYSKFMNNQIEVSKNDIDISVGYIPQRFKLNMKKDNARRIRYFYIDKNHDEVIVTVLLKSTDTNLNTEGAIIEKIEIDGQKAQIWQKGKFYYIVSMKNNISYYIYGAVNEKELIKIAENLKIKLK